MTHLVIYTDGGARSNPGPAAAGIVITKGGETIAQVKQYLGPKQTNNWAEYEAVILAMVKVIEMQLGEVSIDFKLDSKLVVEQVQGNWKIKEPSLKPQVQKVHDLMKNFKSVSFAHIPRDENKEADALVNEALDEVEARA